MTVATADLPGVWSASHLGYEAPYLRRAAAERVRKTGASRVPRSGLPTLRYLHLVRCVLGSRGPPIDGRDLLPQVADELDLARDEACRARHAWRDKELPGEFQCSCARATQLS